MLEEIQEGKRGKLLSPSDLNKWRLQTKLHCLDVQSRKHLPHMQKKMLKFMSPIKPFYTENPFWMRMGIFFIVILIHPIYLWIKRISEGLILQKIWQWEKFFQWGLGCPVSLHPDSHRYLFPTQTGPIAPSRKSSGCLFATCGCSPGPGDGVRLLQKPLLTSKTRLGRNTRSRARWNTGTQNRQEEDALSLSHFLQP